jgi:hypothetical protein
VRAEIGRKPTVDSFNAVPLQSVNIIDNRIELIFET